VKIITFVLLILFLWLQYKIWLQDGGIPEILQLKDEVKQVEDKVEKLQERNASLDAEVKDLKKGLDAIEERARSEMGMIKKGEVYYQVIEPDKSNKESANERK
jgi:cell division protein FtsB